MRSSNYGWVWPISIPPVPKNNQLLKQQDPKSDQRPYLPFFVGFAVSGLEPNNNYVGQDNPHCPGRMNTSPEQESSIIYVTHVRTKDHRYTPRHYNYLSRRAGPCGEAMPTRGRGERRLSRAAEGWQGADANIYETAVRFVLTRLLCVLFFFFLRPVSEKSRRRAVCSGATRAHRCIAQHAPRTHCPSRPGGVD